MAQAGQAMNQTSCAGSPHPHVSVDDGWPDHTCHQSATAGMVKRAMAPRWKPIGPDGPAQARLAARRRPSSAVVGRSSGPPGLPWPGRPAGRGRRAWGASTRPSRSSPPPSVPPPPPDPGASRPGRPSYDRRRARRPPLHRRRRRAPRAERALGAGPPGLGRRRPRGRRRRRATTGRAPRATPASSAWAIPTPSTSRWRCRARDLWHRPRARRRGAGSCTPRAGDVRRRGRAPRHRRRAGGRRRPGRAALGGRGGARASAGSPPAGPVLFEPASGVLAADDCLRALMRRRPTSTSGWARRCVACGDSPAVPSWTTAGRHDTTKPTSSSLCAGPHTLALLGETPARGGRPVAPPGRLLPPRPRPERLDRLPVFIEWGEDMVYGLPVPGDGPHAGTYKVSHHTPGTGPRPVRPHRPGTLRRRPRPRWPC